MGRQRERGDGWEACGGGAVTSWATHLTANKSRQAHSGIRCCVKKAKWKYFFNALPNVNHREHADLWNTIVTMVKMKVYKTTWLLQPLELCNHGKSWTTIECEWPINTAFYSIATNHSSVSQRIDQSTPSLWSRRRGALESHSEALDLLARQKQLS